MEHQTGNRKLFFVISFFIFGSYIIDSKTLSVKRNVCYIMLILCQLEDNLAVPKMPELLVDTIVKFTAIICKKPDPYHLRRNK